MKEVVAALIYRENRFMICQRPQDKAQALLWEFAGGKVEPGETKQQALKREFQEELGVELNVGEMYMEVTHPYEEGSIHLTVFLAEIARIVKIPVLRNDFIVDEYKYKVKQAYLR